MNRITAIVLAAALGMLMLFVVMGLDDGELGFTDWDGVTVGYTVSSLDTARALLTEWSMPLILVGFTLGAALLGGSYLARSGGDREEGIMTEPMTVMVISTLLFVVGLYGLLRRRNAIVMLMSIEVMLGAANLNLIAFSGFWGDARGQVFVLLIIALAAAEVAVGLAILLTVYARYRTADVDVPALLRW